ncbi:hypothetical protein [Methylotuvimicrobium sp. KM2]|uniref:hypothetical protein n=1 Tax=Methylotuvimicrobium sp. KM2 TaxID=3133976 RepID=UPI001D6206BD|nr:hypothetical protein [Gammaproteobacteria bacterium]
MKIDTATSYLHTNQRAQSSAADLNGATSFSTALTTSTVKTDTAGVKQTDFTSMTRQEMRDWVNGQIRSGEMSLDDSRSFMAMTMKVPAGVGVGSELPAADGERIDFTQRVRAGIEGALSRNDQTTLKMLESARQIMSHSQQGQTIGIDTRA